MQQSDKNKFHIAIIGSQASIHVVRWANALVEKGYRITVITMHSGVQPFNADVDIVKLPFKNPFGYVLNIPVVKKIVQELAPDIVHGFYALGYGFLARHSSYRPILLSVMGSDVYDDIENKFLKRIVIKNIEKADVVCSTSYIMRKKIDSLFPNPREVKVTPFGVDTDVFSPRGTVEFDDEYNFVFGTVKGLKPKYGVDILIRSFSKFCKKYPDKKFKLIIAGDGFELQKLKKLTLNLGLERECDFVGNKFHHEIPDLLRKFNVFVALSRLDSESFGVAIVEAMSVELPVIVSDAGGLKEVVENGVTGLVVPKNSVHEAFNAMVTIFENQDLGKKLGENARKKVLKDYHWSDSVFKMESVYKELLSN